MSEAGLWEKELRTARFKLLVGLLILTPLAIVTPILYEYTLKIMQGGSIPESLMKQAELLKDFRYWIWSQWFGKNLLQIGTILALIFGAGSISSEVSRKTIYFVLTKPITRRNVFKIKYLVNLISLETVVILSSLVLYVMIIAVGKEYSTGSFFENLILFAAGAAVIYTIAVFSSTYFDQTMKSFLISGLAVFILSIPSYFESTQRFSLFHQMKGLQIAQNGNFPWIPFIFMILLTGIIYKAASVRFVKRDW